MDLRTIKLAYVGNEIDKASLKRLREKAKDRGLKDAKITVEQGFQSGLMESGRDNKKQIERLQSEVVHVRETIQLSELKLDSLSRIPNEGKDLLKEINAFLPQIKGCSISSSPYFSVDTDQEQAVPTVLLAHDEEISETEREAIRRWLKQKLKVDYVILNFRRL